MSLFNDFLRGTYALWYYRGKPSNKKIALDTGRDALCVGGLALSLRSQNPAPAACVQSVEHWSDTFDNLWDDNPLAGQFGTNPWGW
ncbi:MAG: hypothetical protein QF752_06205 [Planctomycetota bacterium]|nr:hypothetical protein [Planctomycetota bacterium]